MLASAQPVSSRSAGVRLEDLVAVPIDVGKHKAMAKVVDFTGAELAKPFEFPLDRSGVKALVELPGHLAQSYRLVRRFAHAYCYLPRYRPRSQLSVVRPFPFLFRSPTTGCH